MFIKSKRIFLVTLLIMMIMTLVLIGYREFNMTVIKSDKVWGHGRYQDYVIFNMNQEGIPSTQQQIKEMSDGSRTNVDYVVIYEENKWFKEQRKLLKILRFEREFPDFEFETADSMYHRLVDEIIEEIDENHSVFIRLYEKYEQNHNLWGLEPVSIVIPKVQSITEAKQKIIETNPDFLRLLPITIVEEEILQRWNDENYDPVREYTDKSPQGLTIDDILGNTNLYENIVIKMNGEIVHVDLSGDNKKESVSLTTADDKTITLHVNDQSINVPRSVEDVELLFEEPAIHILHDDESQVKLLLFSMVWKTNKIGTSTDLLLYKYTDNELVEIKIDDQLNKNLSYKLSQYLNGQATLEIPEYSLTTQITIDPDYYDAYLSSHLSGEIDELGNVMYYVNDYDTDQTTELIIEKIISTGAVEWLPFRIVYEVYRVEGEDLKFIKVIPNDPSYGGVVRQIITDGSIPLNTVDPSTIELIPNDIIKKSKDRIYLNLSK